MELPCPALSCRVPCLAASCLVLLAVLSPAVTGLPRGGPARPPGGGTAAQSGGSHSGTALLPVSLKPVDHRRRMHSDRGCLHHGKVYRVYAEVPSDACKMCYCGLHGKIECIRLKCPVPQCVNPVPADVCCFTCPTGPNCMLPGKEGEIISRGDVKISHEGTCIRYCYCMKNTIEAVCHNECS